MNHLKRAAALALAIGLSGAVGAVFPAYPAAADVGFYNLAAEASGLSGTFGDPATEPYPTAAGTVPETQATLGSGPIGYALASALWPGPLAANAGSLANLVLPACAPAPAPPGTCSPKPDAQTLALANYPVRAEASSGGQRSTTLGPLVARTEGEVSEASATFADTVSPGFVSVARIATRSRSSVEDGNGVALATSTLSGINISNGALTIDAINTTARGTTDGDTASTERSIIISGVKVQGQDATIDESGVHFVGQSVPDPFAAPADAANTALASMGIKVFVVKTIGETKDGGAARTSTGSVAVVWTLGEGPQVVILTLGGATVRVQGSPELDFDSALPDLGSVGSTGDLGGGGADLSLGGSSFDSGGGLTTPSITGGGGGGGGGGTDQLALDLEPAAYERGISISLIIITLLAALLASTGLRRIQERILAPGGGGCANPRRPE